MNKAWKITVAILFVLLTFLFGILSHRQYRSWSPWPGYVPLLIEESANSDAIISLLHLSGYSEIVSRDTITLKMSDFSDVGYYSLRDIEEKFLLNDPRRDPFLERIDSLFYIPDYQILYIKYNKPIWIMYFQFRKILTQWNWELPMWDPVTFIIPYLFYVIYSLLFLLFRKKDRWAAILSLLPLFFSIYGYPDASSVFLLLHTSAFLIPTSGKKKSGKRTSSVDFLFLLPVALSLIFLIMVARQVLIPALIFISSIYSSRFLFRSSSRIPLPLEADHVLFQPVLISPTSYSAANLRRLQLHLNPPQNSVPFKSVFLPLVAVGIFWTVLVFYAEKDPIPIPVPVYNPGSESYSLDSLKKLFEENNDDFPNISQYIAHNVYQDFYLYNEPYGSLYLKKEISLSTFFYTDGKIVEEKTIIANFSESWLKSYIKEELSDGLSLLLLSPEQPVRITLGIKPSGLIPDFNKQRWAYYSLLALIPIFGIIVLANSRQGNNRSDKAKGDRKS